MMRPISAIMSADDDTELRDLLVQTLEKNGTLSRIRAQLRASVFLALEEQEGTKKKTPLLNEKANQFNNAENGRLCMELVADLLESLNLDATMSVLAAECSLDNRRSRSNLASALKLPSNASNDGKPLLMAILESDRAKPRDNNAMDLNAENKQSQSTKPKQTSGDGFVNGSTVFGSGKSMNDDNSDDDFFGGATKPASKRDTFPNPSGHVTIRDKNVSATTKEKELKDDGGARKDSQKSGSSLSFLADLPTLSRPALPSLTKEKGPKDTDFMKLLGDSLDDTDRDSSPRDSARMVPGLDLKKLDTKPDAKNQEKSVATNSKSTNEPAKIQRKDSSADEEISEEIAEDLEVDDLLDSERSSRQLSF